MITEEDEMTVGTHDTVTLAQRWAKVEEHEDRRDIAELHRTNPGTDRGTEVELMWITKHGLPY
jgi:4-alpha-glucanotransferase